MRVRVIAVGTRMPAWVRSGCEEYLGRLKGGLPVALTEIEPAVRRAGGGGTQQSIAAEGRRLLGALAPAEHVVALDERGRELTTRELASWLGSRMQQGEDLAFVIGGPDGLAPEVLSRSNFTLALSRLTLPHALARVLLAEQLYRAHSILGNHPYHRD
jgi:23S rRNA (pseudouridine1915-N3)-methyltransferase